MLDHIQMGTHHAILAPKQSLQAGLVQGAMNLFESKQGCMPDLINAVPS